MCLVVLFLSPQILNPNPVYLPLFLKKNLNAPRSSEHPPVRRENVKTFIIRWYHRLQRHNNIFFMAFIKRVLSDGGM